MTEPLILFLGNCQAQALANLYDDHVGPYLGRRARWIDAWDTDRQKDVADLLGQAELVAIQRFSGKPPVTIGELPTGVREIGFPDVRGNFLWPYGGGERTGNPRPWFMTSGPYNPEVGDSFLDRQIRENVPPEDALARYLDLDIAHKANLGRLMELGFEQQRAKDAATGFSISEYIERRFREERLFLTPGHLSRGLFAELADQTFTRLDVRPPLAQQALGRIAAQPFERYHEAPLHPGVIAYHHLGYADATTRYHHLQEGSFGFEERVLRYMRCQWVPELHEARRLIRSEPSRALELLEQGLRQAPGSAFGYFWRAEALHALGRFEEECGALEQAVRIEPQDTLFATHLSFAYNHVGLHDHAIATALDAEQVMGRDGGLDHARAQAYADLGRFDAAVPLMERAAEWSPRDAYRHRVLADFRWKAGDHVGAERTRRALAMMGS